MGSKGIVASSAALAVLLQEGIGDTIRISLTPEPNESRTREVIVAQELLQTMGLRAFTPLVTACPGCGRTTSVLFQELAKTVQERVREKMPEWRIKYDGVENLTLAVMGCIVNGPGESKHANIGISLPGTGEAPAAPVFVDGVKTATLRGGQYRAGFCSIDRRIRREELQISASDCRLKRAAANKAAARDVQFVQVSPSMSMILVSAKRAAAVARLRSNSMSPIACVQSVNVKVSVPHGVWVKSASLKFGGNLAPSKITAGIVVVLLVGSYVPWPSIHTS